MYYYRRRSSAGSLFLWLIISAIVVLIISPRARQKLSGFLEMLSLCLMGVGRDIGRQVNKMGITITDRFRTYKLADLAGAIKRTFTTKKEYYSNPDEQNSDIVYYDLTSDDEDEDDDTIHYQK